MDVSVVVAALGDWSAGRGPLYRRLAGQLHEVIRCGVLGTGSRLPSERDLAVALAVSRTTVIAAYRVLRENGLLESLKGSGTRVKASGDRVGPAVPAAALPTEKLPRPPGDAVNLASAVFSSPHGLPEELLHLTPDDFHHLCLQGVDYEPLGLPALRSAIAAHYTRLELPTTPEELLITTGGQQAIALLFTLFGRDAGAIVTENPTYVGAVDAARAIGARLLALPIGTDGVNLRALRTALHRSEVRLVYLMSTCHNPTGTVLSVTRRHAIAHLAASTDIPVVDDTSLADLRFDGQPPMPLAADKGIFITIGSLSKLLWPGLRVGWVRAPAPLIARLARLKIVADLGSSQVSQLFALRFLEMIDKVAVARRTQLAQRCDLLTDLLREQLPDWSWVRPLGGPFLWARLPHTDTETFAQAALRHGVQILPGVRCSPDNAFADHLRIAYVAEPAEIKIAVHRLRDAWIDYHQKQVDGQPSLRGVFGPLPR